MALVKIAKVSDLKPGEGTVIEADGQKIALFNVDGAFHALDNTCVHKGGPLGDGDLDGPIVTCPWHGWTYDVTSGECTTNPQAKVSCFSVKVEGEDIIINKS